MLEKNKLKINDLIYFNDDIHQIKKINLKSITTYNDKNIKFTDIAFKITNEEAKKIILSKYTAKVYDLMHNLKNLRSMVKSIHDGSLTPYIIINTDTIEDDIQCLIENITEDLDDLNN